MLKTIDNRLKRLEARRHKPAGKRLFVLQPGETLPEGVDTAHSLVIRLHNGSKVRA